MARLLSIQGLHPGTAPRVASSDPGPHADQGAAATRPSRLESGSGDGAIADFVTPPSVVVHRAATNQAIDAALCGLPEHYRAAIHLRLWEDLSFAEIGSRLEISDDCAQKLYGRAIVRLRQLLGPGHEPG